MKKLVLTSLIAATFSTAAMAQVTVFGIIDQAVRSSSPDSGTSSTGMVSGSYWTPKIGFKADEDLGNGNKVSVLLESRIDAGQGTAGVGDRFFSLESSVSLTSSQLGTLTLGMTDTSDSEAVDAFVGIRNFGNFSFTTGAEYAVNRNNTVRYTSPKIGGAELQVGRSFKTATLAELDSVSLTYDQGMFGVALGYDKTGNDTYTAAGVRANLGVASVGAMYGQRDAATNVDVMAVTANVPLGNGFSARGAYKTNEVENRDKITISTVGITKDLSKRTMIHAVYQDTDKGAAAGSFYQVGLLHRF